MTSVPPPPSAQWQLAFLGKLQRLFSEGDFTATYKFALLMALADLAVEQGTDDGSELALTVRQIAERFVQMYWCHAAPYNGMGDGAVQGVLVQNRGTQAAVVSAILQFRARSGARTLQQAKAVGAYAELLSEVAKTVAAQPLAYMQNFGGVEDQFLYERRGRGVVVLKEYVAYCLRRFHPLVQQLARGHWVGHIKANRLNHTLLGDAGDLEDFLFGSSRQSLAVVGEGLRKLDGARCFYCGHAMVGADVDHFVPFALYPRDMAHNFVLAHPQCNRSKSDSLAGKQHLERWVQRLTHKSAQLQEIGNRAGMVADAHTTRRVAAWGYGNGYQSGSRAWLKAARYEAIDLEYLACLAA